MYITNKMKSNQTIAMYIANQIKPCPRWKFMLFCSGASKQCRLQQHNRFGPNYDCQQFEFCLYFQSDSEMFLFSFSLILKYWVMKTVLSVDKQHFWHKLSIANNSSPNQLWAIVTSFMCSNCVSALVQQPNFLATMSLDFTGPLFVAHGPLCDSVCDL